MLESRILVAAAHLTGNGPKGGKHDRRHGKWKDIEVILSNDEEPAIGTGLLQGSVATLDFVKNRLTIEEPIRAKRKKR